MSKEKKEVKGSNQNIIQWVRPANRNFLESIEI